MKSLIFEQLSLMSPIEKKARKVKFDQKITVLLGDNHTGKSSLLKSIYWVLGADPAQQHSTWTGLNIAGLLHFRIDGKRYSAVRSGSRFGLFNDRGSCEIATGSMREYAPVLARHIEFKLQLKVRQSGSAEIPPTAFCFLPFYADQDKGWQQPWQSFGRLGQYSKWQVDTMEYHSGIRPNEYYELADEKAQLEKIKSDLSLERGALARAVEKLKSSRSLRPLPIDQEKYRTAIEEFLRQLQGVDAERLKVTKKLGHQASKRALLEQQASIAKTALSELDRDYAFVRDDISPAIECPTCGIEHENSFVNRYALVEDQEECRSFLVETRQEIEDVEKKMAKLNSELSLLNSHQKRINDLLQQDRGAIKLEDVIEAEGEQRAREVVESELSTLTEQVAASDAMLKALKTKLDALSDPERKTNINEFYFRKMGRNLRALGVENLAEDDYNVIKMKLHNTGSAQPRAVLAYYFSFIQTMIEYSSSPLCPIVLDTPKQQDQDDINAEKIIKFIFANRPEQAQLIVGTGSLQDITNPGTTILLSEKYSLLKREHYNDVADELAFYLNQLI